MAIPGAPFHTTSSPFLKEANTTTSLFLFGFTSQICLACEARTYNYKQKDDIVPKSADANTAKYFLSSEIPQISRIDIKDRSNYTRSNPHLRGK